MLVPGPGCLSGLASLAQTVAHLHSGRLQGVSDFESHKDGPHQKPQKRAHTATGQAVTLISRLPLVFSLLGTL